MKRTELKRGKPLSPGNKPLKRTGFKKQSGNKPRKKTGARVNDKNMAKADKLWSILVWHMHDGKCAMCGSPVKLEERHPHHGIGRGVKLFRHDPNNGFLFDGHCHNFDEKAPHKSAEKFMEWLRGKYPERAKWLEDNQGKIGTGKPDYEERCKVLKELISEYS